MQYKLLRLLASHNRITVIGDDDQVIFLNCMCLLILKAYNSLICILHLIFETKLFKT